MTDFRINKNEIIKKFKKFVDEHVTPNDTFAPLNAKEIKVKKLDVLDKILFLYEFVVKKSMIDLKRHYISDDVQFNNVKNKLQSYVKNKLRSTSDGHIYINVNNLIEFDGDKDQYYDEILKTKTKQSRVIRNIVDELNSYLDGNRIEEKGKPFLLSFSDNKLNEEEFYNIIANLTTDEIFSDMLKENFSSFREMLNEFFSYMNVPNWDFNDMVSKMVLEFKNSISTLDSKTDFNKLKPILEDQEEKVENLLIFENDEFLMPEINEMSENMKEFLEFVKN